MGVCDILSVIILVSEGFYSIWSVLSLVMGTFGEIHKLHSHLPLEVYFKFDAML